MIEESSVNTSTTAEKLLNIGNQKNDNQSRKDSIYA
jgi:hypothetical protein